MLSLTGTILNAHIVPEAVNRKTGERYGARPTVQLSHVNKRGLVELVNLTVPDIKPYLGREGQECTFPVHAYAIGAPVQFQLAE